MLKFNNKNITIGIYIYMSRAFAHVIIGSQRGFGDDSLGGLNYLVCRMETTCLSLYVCPSTVNTNITAARIYIYTIPISLFMSHIAQTHDNNYLLNISSSSSLYLYQLLPLRKHQWRVYINALRLFSPIVTVGLAFV